MAAMAMNHDDYGDDKSDDTMKDDQATTGASAVGLTVEIDKLKVVACVEGSIDYHRLYHEIRANFAQASLSKDTLRLRTSYQEPPHEELRSMFLRQLREVKQQAERNMGKSIEIAALSLPSYWFDELKDALLQASALLDEKLTRESLLCHEETARLAYNLGDRRNRGTWFLVLVEYNTENLYLTFTEMNDLDDPDDHPKYPVDGQYLLQHLGETSPTRAAGDGEHYDNIRNALGHFLLNHVAKDADNIEEWRDLTLWEFPYSDIKGVILTGDASNRGMRAMDRVLREVFADLPQCESGNIFTNLRPSHVVALGTARAVRSKLENDYILEDAYSPVAIED